MLTATITAPAAQAITAQLGIKLVLLAAVVVLVFLITRIQGARNLALRRLITVAFAILAGLAIIFPQTLSSVANFLGVGRGTDLILYALVVFFFASLVVHWRTHNQHQRELTLVARRLAILEARLPQDPPEGNEPLPK